MVARAGARAVAAAARGTSAAAQPPGAPALSFPADALEVGRIVDAWGLKGSFRVQAYAGVPGALLEARRWHLRPAEVAAGSAAAAALPSSLEITEAHEHGAGLVATARGVGDRNAAEALRGARIFVARSSFPEVAADEFYWADLIGLAVANREGVALGSVIGLIDTGPHSVLRVAPDDASLEERLVPFVAAYVDSVDLARRCICVDWQLDY